MRKKTFFSVEYDFQASPQLLFQYLSTPSGLSEWFADNVNSRGENFVFIWDDTEEKANLLLARSEFKEEIIPIETKTTLDLDFFVIPEINLKI